MGGAAANSTAASASNAFSMKFDIGSAPGGAGTLIEVVTKLACFSVVSMLLVSRGCSQTRTCRHLNMNYQEIVESRELLDSDSEAGLDEEEIGGTGLDRAVFLDR